MLTLILLLFGPLLGILRLLLHLHLHLRFRVLSLLNKPLNLFRSNLYLLQIDIGSIFEGVHLANSSLNFIGELVRPHTLYNPVGCIGEDNVTLGVELQNEMVAKLFRSEGEHHHSLHTNLPDSLESLRSQILPELNYWLDIPSW